MAEGIASTTDDYIDEVKYSDDCTVFDQTPVLYMI